MFAVSLAGGPGGLLVFKALNFEVSHGQLFSGISHEAMYGVSFGMCAVLRHGVVPR